MLFPIKDVNPTSRFPIVTVVLIVVNVLVYVYQRSLGEGLNDFIAAFGAIPYEITRGVDLVGRVDDTQIVHAPGPSPLSLTLVLSMFMHGGLMHLGGNMLYLWIFGNNVEDMLGRATFIVFYLLSGLAAAVGQIVPDPASTVPMLGASGAVSGVLGAYLIMFPRAHVTTFVFVVIFFRIIRLPAMIVLGGYFALQLIQGVASLGIEGAGGVAWFAHIGGFVAGVALALVLGPRWRPKRANILEVRR